MDQSHDENKPTKTQKIHALAKLIDSVSKIAGFLFAVFIFISQFFSGANWAQPVLNAFDRLINAERFSEGYVYYEVAPNGTASRYGQIGLNPDPGDQQIGFSELEEGMILYVISKQNLRTEDTGDSSTIRILGRGQCVEILDLTRELTGEDLGTAKSGGWLEVKETECAR